MINAVGTHRLRANLCMLIRSQYIKNDLTAEFSLVLGIKDKATCSVTDLFNHLHYHLCQYENSTTCCTQVHIAHGGSDRAKSGYSNEVAPSSYGKTTIRPSFTSPPSQVIKDRRRETPRENVISFPLFPPPRSPPSFLSLRQFWGTGERGTHYGSWAPYGLREVM